MRNHKTLDDVRRVIALGKPDTVIEIFINDHLAGVALAPVYAAETEYSELLAQTDREPSPEMVDNDGTVITPAVDHNQIRDDRIAALEDEYPHLADSELDRPEPVIDDTPLRVSLVNELRRASYPDIGDQLDAIWKQLNYDRMNGRTLIQELADRLGEINAVKAKHKKKAR